MPKGEGDTKMTESQKTTVEQLAQKFNKAANALIELSILVWNDAVSQNTKGSNECSDYLVELIEKDPNVKALWQTACSSDY